MSSLITGSEERLLSKATKYWNRRKGLSPKMALCSLAIVVLTLSPWRSVSAQTAITTCGTNITAAGSYFLPADLDCSSAATQVAVAVNASGVDLNLNGKTLTGPMGDASATIALGATSPDCAFSSGSISNVRVHGGTIAGVSKGLFACQITQSIFDGLTVEGRTDQSQPPETTPLPDGILLEDQSNNDFVLVNRIVTSDIGIEIGTNNDGSDVDTANSIEGNTVTAFGSANQTPSSPETAGILLYTGATLTQVTNNTVTGGWLNGIDLRRCASPVGHPPCDSGPSMNFLQQNLSNGNTTGIRLSGSAGNRIQDNNAKNNQTGKDMAGVIDDNNSAPRRPCANTWVDNFYDGKLGKLRCIPGSKRNSVSGN
jgi:parallel beta-helix repeat protein